MNSITGFLVVKISWIQSERQSENTWLKLESSSKRSSGRFGPMLNLNVMATLSTASRLIHLNRSDPNSLTVSSNHCAIHLRGGVQGICDDRFIIDAPYDIGPFTGLQHSSAMPGGEHDERVTYRNVGARQRSARVIKKAGKRDPVAVDLRSETSR